jgi:lipid-A-disaccharide synthase
MKTSKAPLIFFSAGDPSGDRNTAPVITKLKEHNPQTVCKGLGGPAMERAGFENLFNFANFNILGYIAVFKNLKFFLKAKNNFIQLLRDEKPDLLVCVDSSGFNTPLMIAAKELGIPVLWYIAPMIWAWKRYKHGPKLAKYATHIATILPFEPEEWHEFTQNVSFVGSPLCEISDKTIVADKKSKSDTITIALVPGSRKAEVNTILPIMVESVKLLSKKHKNLEVIFSETEYISQDCYKVAVDAGFKPFTGTLEELYNISDMAIVTSGTATLQATLATTPHAVVYKMATIPYLIAKHLLKLLNYLALANTIAKKMIVPEFVQKDAKPSLIAEEIEKLITQKEYYNSQVEELSKIRAHFGDKKPSEELTKLILEMVDKK